MGPMQQLRAATAALVVVVSLPFLQGAAVANAAPVSPGSVVEAATSVGASAGPMAGSAEAIPSGSNAGSVGSLDAGSGLATSSDAPAGAPGSLGALGSLAPSPPIESCPGPAPQVRTFGDTPAPVLGWSENLAFDDLGRVWVSKTFLDRVDAYSPDGRVVDSVAVRAPGGIALGPDGRMHVAAGTGYLADRSDVVTFDPAADGPEARLEAELDSRKNGLAVDADGNRYLTSLDDHTLTKVAPDGQVDQEWSSRAAIGVSNGIAIEGDTAYVTQSTSQTVLLSVPLDRPDESTETVLTAPPAVARGLDDLAVTDDAFYVTSWTTGEVFHVERDTGEACVAVSGIPRATAVVVADGFGDFGERDLLVTSLHGPIRHVTLP